MNILSILVINVKILIQPDMPVSQIGQVVGIIIILSMIMK